MKTTRKEYNIFKSECDWWISFLGLTSWKIVYQHKDTDLDARADIEIDHGNKIATIFLSVNFDDSIEYDLEQIKETAFHEVDELKYSQIRHLLSTFYSEDIADGMIHELIRSDENTIYRFIMENRK